MLQKPGRVGLTFFVLRLQDAVTEIHPTRPINNKTRREIGCETPENCSICTPYQI